MASDNQKLLMEGILFPHSKVQNKKRSISRRLLSRKKYLQRQATNLKSFPKIESPKNEISIQPDERYKSFAPSVNVQLPDDSENFILVDSCFLILTTIIHLYFWGFL